MTDPKHCELIRLSLGQFADSGLRNPRDATLELAMKRQLTDENLALEHNVDVSIKRGIELKRLDTDFLTSSDKNAP